MQCHSMADCGVSHGEASPTEAERGWGLGGQTMPAGWGEETASWFTCECRKDVEGKNIYCMKRLLSKVGCC